MNLIHNRTFLYTAAIIAIIACCALFGILRWVNRDTGDTLLNRELTEIDIQNGFEQELTTGNENGNLAIRDFLIKDYPIIIRLSK